MFGYTVGERWWHVVYRHILTIGRFTALEALRTRVPVLALVVMAILLCASLFVRELAVAESLRFQTGLYAAAVRLCAVFMTSLYVLASMTREFNDKGLEVLLALDVPRSHYIFGKMAGFLVTAAIIAAVLSLPLWVLAPAGGTGAWALSLAIELALLALVSLFCVVTFSHLLPAASVVAAIYLLTRSITAMQLMSAHPLTGQDTAAHQVMAALVDALAWLTPPLDAWTQTAWLVDAAPGAAALAGIAGQGLIAMALLTAATLFDFHRRSL